MGSEQIVPVILSGGSGTRLWPLSREHYPKQLLPLTGNKTLLQQTAERVRDSSRYAAPIIVCNEEHRFIIAEQMREIGIEPRAIVLEPVGRNTAPAAAVTALMLKKMNAKGNMLLLPADHVIRKEEAFQDAVVRADEAADAGRLVTFGITPTSPETGYGYIRLGGSLGKTNGVHVLEEFVEKPDRARAEAFVRDGEHAWNSGMFLFPIKGFLAALKQFVPEVLEVASDALAKAKEDLTFLRLDKEAFSGSPSISIDYAVMEKTKEAAVVPVDLGWNDVGAWSALWDISEKDAHGNHFDGDVVSEGAKGCYVKCGDRLTALVGVEDVTVIVTDDAVLVARRDKAQDIKKVVDRLKKDNRSEVINHRKVYRPWGFYDSIYQGDRAQAKRITVKPGAKLSLQKHFHRAEHWVVINGTALVTRGEEQVLLHENESIYIPLGEKHRLENPGKVPLTLIEVQSGEYLGEDDIVRFEDDFGRTKASK